MPIRTYLTPEEITVMIDTATNLRDQLVIAFLSDTGCRVSELLAVTVADIDLDRQEVMIPHLKRGVKKHCPKCGRASGRSTKFCVRCGNNLTMVLATGIEERTRLITIGRQTADLIKSYLSTRGSIATDKPLIALTRQMVYNIVRDAANAVGLAGRLFINPETGKKHYIHPHDFRSALAVSWLQVAGTDANKQKALQDHLGHKLFETTMRYNKLTPSVVRGVGDEVRLARFGSR